MGQRDPGMRRAEVQQATPLSNTRDLVSGSRMWWSGLKGVVGKDTALCGSNGQEKLTGVPGSWWAQVLVFRGLLELVLSLKYWEMLLCN